MRLEASWRSGYAEDCKSLYGGSIPSEASKNLFARVRFGFFVFDRLSAVSQRSRYACDHAVTRDAPYTVFDF